MKKILMGTTALVAAGAISGIAPAQAADPIQITISGYMEQWLGYGNNNDAVGDTQDVNVSSETEIQFDGRTTLDNGITFGVNVQLEGNTSADQMDESFMFIQGGFGRILFGSENSADQLMHVAPPDVGIGLDSGDVTAWITSTTGGVGDTSKDLFGDAEKLTYFTPRFAGLQFGVTYAPSAQEDDVGNVAFQGGAAGNDGHDGVGVGLNYTQDFGSFNIAASGSFGYISNDNLRAQNSGNAYALSYSTGLNVGVGPITVGAAFGAITGNGGLDPTSTTTSTGLGDGYSVSGGVAYQNGPIGVSANMVFSKDDRFRDQFDEESTSLETGVSGRYTLGPGISAVSTIGWAQYDTEFGGGAANSGVFAVGGFALNF